MLRIFSNRRLLTLAILIIASNLIITGVSLIIIYNKSISSLKTNLIDIIDRQKSLFTALNEQGKNSTEIIQLIKVMRNKHYGIGKGGEFEIAQQIGDRVNYLLTHGGLLNVKIENPNNHGMPMKLALQGKTGFVIGEDYKGVDVYAAYTFIPTLGWGIVAKIPTHEVNRPYHEAIMVAIPIIILLIFLSILLFVKIADPLMQSIIENEKYYRNMFSNHHVNMLLINPSNGNIVDANPAACKFYGYEHDALISMNISQINVLPLDELKQKISIAKSGNDFHFFFKHKLSNGTIRDVEVSSGIIGVKGEELLYSIVYDISERIQSEIKRKESEGKFTTYIDNSPTPVFIANKEGQFTFSNPSACQLLGYNQEELLQLFIPNILNSESLNEGLRGFQELQQNGEIHNREFQFIRKDGTIRDVIVDGKKLYENEFIAFVKDISDIKLVMNQLKAQNDEIASFNEEYKTTIEELQNTKDKVEESEIRFKALHNASFGGLIIHDKGIILECNQGLSEITGYSYKELIGMDGLLLIAENSREQVMTNILSGSEKPYDTVGLRKNGDQFPLRIEARNIPYKGKIVRSTEFRDISQQKQAEKDIIIAKEKAEESDRLKTAFLQNMSHEIRTPMNAIMGFSELLTDNYNNKPKLENFSKIINQRCNDLLNIINDILDIAKIESGQVPVNVEKCNLDELFTELTTFFTEHHKRIGKQQIKFSLQAMCDSPQITIVIDKIKLKQIFINLIGNAFKFTESGKIEGGCKFDENQTLVFYVSDSGIGIPFEKQNFIFERFAQLEQSPDHFYGGTGLGLSIVKGLVDVLGGKIWLESELNKGTIFYFSFPYEVVVNSSIQEDLAVVNQEKYNFLNKTILIVEDDIYNAKYIREILDGTGFEILQSINGNDAIQISKSQKLDMVLMDIRLPDMDGYVATRMIKKLKPDLKIIAQTAYAALDDKEKAIESGCNDYISKPIKRDTLLAMINKHMAKY